MERGYKVVILGASGAVGRELINVLEERDFPVESLTLLASERSEGMKLEFRGEEHMVRAVSAERLAGHQIALFSPGAEVSRQWAPVAAKAGAIVIDNTSAFRMDKDIPLIVPEVNPDAVSMAKNRNIIANPNCSTIQMVVALKPLHDAARIKRIVVATYQAVSGKGQHGIDELEREVSDLMNMRETEPRCFPHRIAFNLLPHIDSFTENGYTKEEMKMVNETRKILGDESIQISATCVRVPVFMGHSEAVNITTERKLTAAQARELLSKAPGIKVLDDPAQNIYPMPMLAVGDSATHVGRVREDISQPNGLDLFVCADNLRKGAALNAVQIAELLVERKLV
jgi:aspartate-semialdehyde dehydrogenase